MTEWNRVRRSFDRSHSSLFSGDRYTAEFFNISQGTRSNLNDSYSGENRSSIGSVNVEIVPPAIDTTVRTEGTSFSWDTSIRFPEDDKPGELKPLGEDNEQPTEVEITDIEDDATDVYQLHGYSYELGSDMLMCRLVEE